MFFVNPKHFAPLTYSGELDGNGVEDLVEKKKNWSKKHPPPPKKKLYNEAKSTINNLMFFKGKGNTCANLNIQLIYQPF